MIITVIEKTVGKYCTVELTTNENNTEYVVRGFYGDCVNYNFEVFKTYEEAKEFYDDLNTVRKCKKFYQM